MAVVYQKASDAETTINNQLVCMRGSVISVDSSEDHGKQWPNFPQASFFYRKYICREAVPRGCHRSGEAVFTL